MWWTWPMRLPTNSSGHSHARARKGRPPKPTNRAPPKHTAAPAVSSWCVRVTVIVPPSLQSGINAMGCVRRDEDVPTDINPGAGTFLERDDGEPIEEVIQHLLTFGGRLFGDPVANLRGGRENAPVVADLRQATEPTN